MSENNPDTEDVVTNPFAARTIFPEPASILQFRPKSLEAIKDSCLFAFDTNVLLLPYTTAPKNLEAIRKVLSQLASEKRIFLPAQVIREFAKNRATKLTEVHKQITDKYSKISKWSLGKYTLLENVDEYKNMIEMERKANEHISEYQKSVEKVIAVIKKWNWNDPVTLLYSDIFTEGSIIDTSMSDQDLKQNLQTRNAAKIPPGYKDANKPTNSGGDLSIWFTILEIGKSRNQDMILVSNDVKADWWHQSGGQNLYPRFELVEEYRRETEGHTFHILKMSDFLELFETEASIVQEIRYEEQENTYSNQALQEWVRFYRSRIVASIQDWLYVTVPQATGMHEIFSQNKINYNFEVMLSWKTVVVKVIPVIDNMPTNISAHISTNERSKHFMLVIVFSTRESFYRHADHVMDQLNTEFSLINFSMGFLEESGQYLEISSRSSPLQTTEEQDAK